MPRPSAACKLIDCNRCHHAKGYCRRHYAQHVTKKQRSATRTSETPQSAKQVSS